MNPRQTLQAMPEKQKQGIIDELNQIRGINKIFSRTLIENAVKSSPDKYPEISRLIKEHPARTKDTFWITLFLNNCPYFELWNSKYCDVPVWRYIGSKPLEVEA